VRDEAAAVQMAAAYAPRMEALLQQMIGDDTHAATSKAIGDAVKAIGSAARVGLGFIALTLSVHLVLPLKESHRRIERLLKNPKLGLDWRGFSYVRHVLGDRTEALIALDWTDFEHDGQTTLCAYLATKHGRATPLWWKTVSKKGLTPDERIQAEDEVLTGLRNAMGSNVRVRLLCDRGFVDAERVELWTAWGWDYVIRIRRNTMITDATGKSKRADEWLRGDGRAIRLAGASFTRSRQPVGSFVAVKQSSMKEPWLLICDAGVAAASEAIALYGMRFTTEETFRDQQDPRFGLGLDFLHLKDPAKRDRLLMLAAYTQVLLTLLGAAGEACGLDVTLHPKGGASQGKKRIYSLFRQGCIWFTLLPSLPEQPRGRLLDAFEQILQQHQLESDLLSVV
jgi:hypothetical protein